MLASVENESATSTQSGAMKNATNSAASGRTRGESAFLICSQLAAMVRDAQLRCAPHHEGRELGAAAHSILILRSPRSGHLEGWPRCDPHTLISRLNRSISAPRCGLSFTQSMWCTLVRSAPDFAIAFVIAPSNFTFALVGIAS